MDHDEQMIPQKKLIEAKRYFLNYRLDDDTQVERYNLEEEFAKAAQNRSLLIPMTMVGILAGAILLGAVFTLILEATRSVSPAVMDNFQEIRLREVFNEARRQQQALDNVRRELEGLVLQRDTELNQVRQETDSALALLSQRRLSTAQRNAQQAQIRRNEAHRVREIEARYAPQIRQLEEEKARLEASTRAFQERLAQADRRRQVLVASSEAVAQRQTASIQAELNERLQRLQSQSRETLEAERAFHQEFVKLMEERHAEEIRQTILRYNPIFTEEAILEILALQLPTELQRPSYERLLTEEGVWNQAEYNRVSTLLNQQLTLWEHLKQIPYENSIPQALDRMKELTLASTEVLDRVWVQAAERFRAKNQLIAEKNDEIQELKGAITQLQQLLSAWAESIPERGFVGRVESPQRLQLWLKAAERPQIGQRYRVVQGGTQVGVVEVTAVEGGVFATTISELSRAVRSLDRLLPAAGP